MAFTCIIKFFNKIGSSNTATKEIKTWSWVNHLLTNKYKTFYPVSICPYYFQYLIPVYLLPGGLQCSNVKGNILKLNFRTFRTYRAGFLNCCTISTMEWIILCCWEALLWTVKCLTATLAFTY